MNGQEALLLGRDLTFSSHSAVIAAYGKEFARPKILDLKFHRYLMASLDTRQTGDYGLETKVTSIDAVQLVQCAEEFVKAAQIYLGDS